MKHYDFFGRELMVGDRVAYIDSKYQELRNGEILKLNEKQVTIRNLDDDGLFGDKMGYGRTCRGYGCIVKKVWPSNSNKVNQLERSACSGRA